jgi:hypothetical protein
LDGQGEQVLDDELRKKPVAQMEHLRAELAIEQVVQLLIAYEQRLHWEFVALRKVPGTQVWQVCPLLVQVAQWDVWQGSHEKVVVK